MNTIKLRTVLAATFTAISALAVSHSATAQVRAAISVGEAPPPLRAEVVPAPRHGYVWAPGYWAWSGHRHVWHPGTWVRARPGFVYSAPGWVQHDNRWEFRQGRWARGDADHDGVPNAIDRRPNDPTRR